MEWTHKGIKIIVDDNGYFVFNISGEKYRETTLDAAKDSIDEKTEEYYTFTEKDINALFSKLNVREKHFIQDALTELSCHENNAYCEMGVNTSFIYKFDIEKLKHKII